jgi:hypothetical protein
MARSSKDKSTKITDSHQDALAAFVRTPPSNVPQSKKKAAKKILASTGDTQALFLHALPNFVDDCIKTVDKLIPKGKKKT